VSRADTFKQMFNDATSFNQDISQWDVSNATTFGYMFAEATSFNQDISKWDVSKANDFFNMFRGAASFDQDLWQWPQEARDSCTNGALCTRCDRTGFPPCTDPSTSNASSFETLFVGATLVIILYLSL